MKPVATERGRTHLHKSRWAGQAARPGRFTADRAAATHAVVLHGGAQVGLNHTSCVRDTPASACSPAILRAMNADEQQAEFMSWKIAPARLNATQAAWYLGFEPHEIAMLVGEGLLKPLGHPARNATKFFATQTLDQLRRDEKWLARATDAIADYWRQQNARKRAACERGGVTRGKAIRRAGLAAGQAAALPLSSAPVGTE